MVDPGLEFTTLETQKAEAGRLHIQRQPEVQQFEALGATLVTTERVVCRSSWGGRMEREGKMKK